VSSFGFGLEDQRLLCGHQHFRDICCLYNWNSQSWQSNLSL